MKITIKATVKADMETVWSCWNTPEDIMQWNAASDDWHTTSSTVDLRVGGAFSSRMEAKDGSFGFDFEGKYTAIDKHKLINYVMPDGREVSNTFGPVADGVLVTVVFDAETQNDPEMQRQGWQAILDNFARYAAAKS